MGKRWSPPQNEEQADKLVRDAHQLLAELEWGSDEFDSFVKELLCLAGSFNHHISLQHIESIIGLIVSLRKFAIPSLLEALIDNSRAEQFDLTTRILQQMLHEAERQHHYDE